MAGLRGQDETQKDKYKEAGSMTRWLNITNAAKYAGVTNETIRKWIAEGLRHSRKNSRMVRIKTDWVDEFLEGFEVKPETFDPAKLNFL